MLVRRLVSTGLLALLLAAAARPLPAAPPGSPSSDPRLAGAHRFERDGWVYVHLEGSPEHIGFQHGVLLAPEIGELLRVIKPFLEHSTGRNWAFYREASEKILWPSVDPEYRREIDGIVAGLASRGVAADRWDVVALNANQELPYYYVPWLDRREGKTPVSHAPG
ncbi:MAG: C45 family autoproteolytic acyltransferase/hydrolase, partial [Isosphaeraceae bacterium]